MMTVDEPSQRLLIEDKTSISDQMPARFSTLLKISWWVFTGISICLFALGLPYRFRELLDPSPLEQLAVNQTGLSNLAVAVLMLIPEIILFLVYTTIAISLFIQRPNSLKIIVVSLVLVAWGATIMNVVDALAAAYPILNPWVLFSRAVSWSLVMTLLLIFPNGRLYPRWAKWLLAFWYVWIWSWFFFPSLPHNIAIHGGLADPFRFSAYLLLLGIGLGAQVRRFRKVSSPIEQQETKWAFLGIGLMFVITFIEEAPSAINPSLVSHTTPESILYGLISSWIFVLGSLAFPLGIAASIQQKRLWKIDYVINRSLVYTLMTVFLGLVFIILYHLFNTLFSHLASDQHLPLFIITAALTAVLIFSPTRRAFQWLIDKYVFKIHINYHTRFKKEPSHGLTLLENQTRLGDYQIIEMVARGGMAEIFKGVHVATGQEAAVKVLLEPYAHEERFQKRFLHEAKTISQLDHPNIIKLYDYGETSSLFYLIMEFVSYQSLAAQIVSSGPFSLDYTREIISQTAQGLDYAHQHGIIHRDIKPSNLLLRPTPKGKKVPQPVITDFGIAKTNGQVDSTRTHGLVGSFGYISPEQIRASEDVDQRTDIYSLGVIAFQMLTGQLPFEASTAAGILIAHLQQPAPNILAFIPDIPDPVAFAIMKAMAKDPEDRFNQAGEFALALSQG